jgi:hypothetical protein
MLTKQIIKKNLDLLVINSCSLILGIALYYITCKIELAIALIAGGFTFAFGIRQYEMENDRIFKELFTAFNLKYDEKFNDTLNSIDIEFKNNSAYRVNEKDTKLIIDYLNLCAEEFLWFKKGRISDEVWSAWKSGMSYFLSLGPIVEIVKNESKLDLSYYGLFKELRLDLN